MGSSAFGRTGGSVGGRATTGAGSDGFAGGAEAEALSSLSCGIVSMSGRRNPSSGIAGFDGSGAASGTIVATGAVSVGLLAAAGFASSGSGGLGSGALGLNNEHAGKHARHSAAMLLVKNFPNVQSARIDSNKQSFSNRSAQGRSRISTSDIYRALIAEQERLAVSGMMKKRLLRSQLNQRTFAEKGPCQWKSRFFVLCLLSCVFKSSVFPPLEP